MARPWRKEGRERCVRPTGLTLPQAFSDYAAFFAGRLAGLEAMRVPSEPAAAANAYADDEHLREEGNVVVLHVGGGTAEASVLTGGVYWWQVGPSLTVLSCHPTRILNSFNQT